MKFWYYTYFPLRMQDSWGGEIDGLPPKQEDLVQTPEPT